MSSSAPVVSTRATDSYVSDHDGILTAMNQYVEGVRAGDSSAMKGGFHENCSFFGYFEGQLLAGPIQMLYDWVDGNGPAADMQVRFARIDILNTIAEVRLEMENVKGKLAGASGARFSDLFQLIKIESKWLISQKSFHWTA
jgi:hypothetical protein